MRYRRFGKTNLRLSVLSLGTMRCLASPEVAAETVGAAIAAGVNHLETAQGYGESERYLGAALAQRPEARSQLYVTTKVSPTPERATMERAIAVSLERLGLDYALASTQPPSIDAINQAVRIFSDAGLSAS